MNPDDARPGGLMADANVPADVAGHGGAAERGGADVTGRGGAVERGGADVTGRGGAVEQGGADVTGQGGVVERRRVSFRTSGLMIELEITGSGDSRQMTGRLIPAQSGVVEIRGVVAVEADTRGRFTAEAVPPGQVSVRCRLGTEADRAQVATGWVALEAAPTAGTSGSPR